MQLSGTLQGVISQTLLPKIGGGRVAALEILIATDAVRAMIRESKTSQMITAMQTGSKYGMILLEDRLNQLIAEKKITVDDAVAKANAPQMIKRPGGV
jgi:twitching motility protein PilT